MTDRVGQRFGNYNLIRLIDSGGFAEVYLGKHKELGTEAAIKILLTTLLKGQAENFRAEAQTIAKLIHPQIVRVFDYGVQENIPFMVMDYAPNGTLEKRHPRGTFVPLQIIIPYVKQVAEALQYAHNAKVVHRDIKPENMLVGRNNEILVSDFGIAVVAHTTHSQILQDKAGTIEYMAPEQLQGNPSLASDQYALGVVVYEWLCGTPPFEGTVLEILTQQLSVTPTPLRAKTPTIPTPVELVVLKALAKDPKQRFPSVQEFAEALEQASQSKETINFARLPTTYSIPRVPTTPVKLSSPGTLLLTYRRHASSVINLAWSPDGKYIASRDTEQMVRVWDAATGNDVLTFSVQSSSRFLIFTFTTSHIISDMKWSPRGQHIALSSTSGDVQVWDTVTGTQVVTYKSADSAVNNLAWSPDGQYMVLTREGISRNKENNNIFFEVCAATTEELLFTCDRYSHHTTGVWSPDGKKIALAQRRAMDIRDTLTWGRIFSYDFPPYNSNFDQPVAVAWSPDGQYIAVAIVDKGKIRSFSNTVHVWDTVTGKHIFDYKGHPELNRELSSFNYCPRCGTQSYNSIKACSSCGFKMEECWITHLAWSPDGKRIASAVRYLFLPAGTTSNWQRVDQVQIHDATTGKRLYTYQGHSSGNKREIGTNFEVKLTKSARIEQQ